jgi:membrane protein
MRLALVIYHLISDTVKLFMKVKAARLGAALAFYVMLSLTPLVLMLTGLAGLVFGSENARAQLKLEVNRLIGSEGAQVVDTLLANSTSTTGGVVSATVGLLTLIIGATSVFAQMQEALNTVWEVPPTKKEWLGILAYLRDRLLSLSVVAGLSFLLLVSFVANAVITGIGDWLSRYIGDMVWGISILNNVLSMILAIALFALIFRVLPYRHATWRCVLVGATATAVLFVLGKYLIGLYLGTAAVGSTYGAAGSLVVLLVWVYYSTQILLLGAAFTRVYSSYTQSPVKNDDNVVVKADVPVTAK